MFTAIALTNRQRRAHNGQASARARRHADAKSRSETRQSCRKKRAEMADGLPETAVESEWSKHLP
jgi:hypothetical protein